VPKWSVFSNVPEALRFIAFPVLSGKSRAVLPLWTRPFCCWVSVAIDRRPLTTNATVLQKDIAQLILAICNSVANGLSGIWSFQRICMLALPVMSVIGGQPNCMALPRGPLQAVFLPG
jgi:hypothetical protein